MNKRITFVLASLAMATALTAAPIDAAKALSIATQFSRQARKSGIAAAPQANGKMSIVYTAGRRQGAASYYVAEASRGGYMIISGDDRTQGVIGYVTSGRFDPAQLPANMKYWLSEFQRQIDYLDAHPEARVKAAETTGKESVSPLLGTTAWNQSPYYNKYTPDSNFPIGCVAVSLGQIMRYWQWPERGEGTHSYTSTTHQFQESADFGNTTYNWAAMTDQLNSASSQEAVDAVATLLHDVAVSVEMDYEKGGSGAYSEKMGPAMCNHFRYDKGIQLVKRNFYDTDTWMQMVRTELDNGRPVVYDGATSTMSGHSFVCDGYNADGYYHINWGWGGSGNGYFLLNALAYDYVDMQTGQSMKDGFNYYQDMLIGFKPDRDGSSQYRPHEMLCEGLGQPFDLTVDRGAAVSVMACEVYNTSNYALDIDDLAFNVYDEQGNVAFTKSLFKGEAAAGMYLDTLRAQLQVPAGIADGEYTARLEYKVKGEAQPTPVRMTIGTANEIRISVGADKARYQTEGSPKLTVSLQTQPEVLTSDVPSTVTLHITNDGGTYDGAMSFRLNIAGDPLTKHWYTSPKQDVTIRKGETKDVVFSQTLELAGDDNYELTLFDREDNVIYHTTLPLIGREKEPDLVLTKEIYFTPRDYNVPVNCMILNAEVRNDGGKYDGQMTTRILDTENYFCDGAKMDTMHVVIEGGETKTIRLHGTYNPNLDWSMSNIRVACVYDITSKKYLEPMKYNLHEYTYGSKDESVVWTPDEKDPVSAVEQINKEGDKDAVIRFDGTAVSATSTRGVDCMAVYGADGNLIARQYSGERLGLEFLPAGTYVVVAKTAAGLKALKIQK